MTMIHRNALVPYRASEMYELVADVSSYPDFLPWCSTATADPLTDDEVQATIEIAHGRVRKSFTTLNKMKKDEAIEMHLLDGPFNFLEGRWRFKPLAHGDGGREAGCKVSLDMDFEFSNRLTKMLIGGTFTEIANTLVDAFCTRATEIHGPR